MRKGVRYPLEVRERAVRMVLEHREEYASEWAAILSISQKFGMGHETLRKAEVVACQEGLVPNAVT